MRSSILIFAAALSVPIAAQADIVDIKWEGGEFSHKASIAPKKFLEVCGKIDKDSKIGWRFKGSAPSDFNIHYHVGKDVTYPENRKNIALADGVLPVAQPQDYCWMWSNRATEPITIELTLSRGIDTSKK
jgi:hypothetical protein